MVYILAAISGREVILLGSVENCKGAPWMQWCRKLQASSLKRTHRGLEGPSWASDARVRRGGDEDRHNLQNRIRGHGQGQRSGWCAAPHARIPRQTFGPALHIIRPRPVVPPPGLAKPFNVTSYRRSSGAGDTGLLFNIVRKWVALVDVGLDELDAAHRGWYW